MKAQPSDKPAESLPEDLNYAFAVGLNHADAFAWGQGEQPPSAASLKGVHMASKSKPIQTNMNKPTPPLNKGGKGKK